MWMAVVPTTADVVKFLQEEAGMVLGEDLAYVLDEGAAHETNSFTSKHTSNPATTCCPAAVFLRDCLWP